MATFCQTAGAIALGRPGLSLSLSASTPPAMKRFLHLRTTWRSSDSDLQIATIGIREADIRINRARITNQWLGRRRRTMASSRRLRFTLRCTWYFDTVPRIRPPPSPEIDIL